MSSSWSMNEYGRFHSQRTHSTNVSSLLSCFQQISEHHHHHDITKLPYVTPWESYIFSQTQVHTWSWNTFQTKIHVHTWDTSQSQENTWTWNLTWDVQTLFLSTKATMPSSYASSHWDTRHETRKYQTLGSIHTHPIATSVGNLLLA